MHVNEDGRLCPKAKSSNYHWIQAIRLANDCHSYNTRVCLDKPEGGESPMPRLILEVTRPIKAGHELLLWFSEDILAILQMAFLTPANIQGMCVRFCINYHVVGTHLRVRDAANKSIFIN